MLLHPNHIRINDQYRICFVWAENMVFRQSRWAACQKGISMELLPKLKQHPEIVVFVVSYLAFFVFVMGVSPKYLVWQALPASPEPITKMFFVKGEEVIVMTTSNRKLSCNILDTKACWVEDPYNRQEWLPQCAQPFFSLRNTDLSTEHSLQTAQNCYIVHDYGGHTTAYSLNDDGRIYVKQIGIIGSSGYFLGAIFAAFCTFIFFLGKVAIVGMVFMFQEIYSVAKRHFPGKED